MFRYAPLLGRSPEGELGEHRRRRVLERFAAGNASKLASRKTKKRAARVFPEAVADRVPQSGQRPRPQKLDKVQRSTNSTELVPRRAKPIPRSGRRPRSPKWPKATPQQLDKVQRSTNSQELAPKSWTKSSAPPAPKGGHSAKLVPFSRTSSSYNEYSECQPI